MHLADDRFLQAFARLDEAGEGRVHAAGPALLAPEQAAFAAGDEHDHRRIGARKVVGGAFGPRAAPHVPALDVGARGAADAAEAVPLLPVDEAARVGHRRAVVARDQRADGAEVDERTGAAERRRRVRVVEMRDVDREMRRAVARAAEQGPDFGAFQQAAAGGAAVPYGRRRVAVGDLVAAAPQRQHAALRIGAQARHRRLVAAQIVVAAERHAAVVVADGHRETVAQARPAGNAPARACPGRGDRR